MTTPRQHGNAIVRPPVRGVSLIEAALSVAIVGLVIVAALATWGAAAQARRVRHEASLSELLARDLLHEVLEAQFREPDDVPTWGRESGELAGDRRDWDDTDDYDGWSQSPPETRLDQPMAEFVGWQRSVRVTRVDLDTLAEHGSANETGVRKIEVTVTSPLARSATFTAFRADLKGLEQPPMLDRAYVSHVAVELQIGPEATARVRGSVNCVNLRPPAPPESSP